MLFDDDDGADFSEDDGDEESGSVEGDANYAEFLQEAGMGEDENPQMMTSPDSDSSGDTVNHQPPASRAKVRALELFEECGGENDEKESRDYNHLTIRNNTENNLILKYVRPFVMRLIQDVETSEDEDLSWTLRAIAKPLVTSAEKIGSITEERNHLNAAAGLLLPPVLPHNLLSCPEQRTSTTSSTSTRRGLKQQ
ncbi:hypothetical protein PsorP6_009308 [Peronosclerospora sorghi]|uniref:Uncharacterized protein n=1 Tax=Peronosclerospora sorghi TaxID=230839 RepID=A0ACC0VYW8_9STRA|nr:hypothetical protein PsorP6_009308 [Peronosclerospora sorghi]